VKILTTITGYLGLLLANLVFASLVFVVAIFDRKGRLWWPLGRMWGRTIYWGALSRRRAAGFEVLEWDQPAILMANHESYLDVPAIIASSPVPLRFVARKEVFKTPIMGQAMWVTGQIAIDRSNREQAIASLSAAAKRIASGRTVLVFPEGTRSANGELGPFKKGGFMLALESGAPIIPVGLSGTRDLVPRGSWMYQPSRVGVVMGDPIETRDMTLDDREALIEQVRDAIGRARSQAEQIR